MRVAIASGKGGTGKTLLSTNLAFLLADRGFSLSFVDADVEAPNSHLYLYPELEQSQRFCTTVPALRHGHCAGCGECHKVCHFNAILSLPQSVLVFPELCHACGACVLACPDDSLIEQSRETGTIEWGRVMRGGFAFCSGLLDIGEARATPLIAGVLEKATLLEGARTPSAEGASSAGPSLPGEPPHTPPQRKERASAKAQDTLLEEERASLAEPLPLSKGETPPGAIQLIDAPPGTSCSAMEVALASDLVLLVTEPTPFGLHDLELAVEMCRALERETAVVLNRSDLGDAGPLHDYLQREGLSLLAEIPFEQEVAKAYARGEAALDHSEALHFALEKIVSFLSLPPTERPSSLQRRDKKATKGRRDR